MDEQCDIVDQRDRVIRVKLRRELRADFVNTRYVNVFIRNSRGDFWVPKRRDDLKRWPGGLDFAVGGQVLASENYVAAVLREAKEEVGLELERAQLSEVAYLSPYKYPVSSFMKVYELNREQAPDTTPAEYQSARWYSLPELLDLLNANASPTKTDILPVVRLCYAALSHLDKTLFEP